MSDTQTYPLSDRVQQMGESQTIAMAQRARELTAKGKKVINLSLGEPDFGTPEFIKTAAKRALDQGYTHYTPVPGLPELRQAISDKFQKENNLDYSPEQIVVSNGAKQSLANLFLCLLNPGDEVIVFTPYWVSYIEMIKLAGGVPVLVEGSVANKFKVTPEQVADALTPRTRAVLFSSPCNPTGTVFDGEELAAIAEVLAPHEQVFVISDEIYEYINYVGKHESIGTNANLEGRVVTVNGFSKGFAMTGWRLGYLGAPTWLAKACAKVQGQFTSGANAFAQRAAVTALESSRDAVEQMLSAYRRRRDLSLNLLNKIPDVKIVSPDGAFYIFPDVSAYLGLERDGQKMSTTTDLCLYLLSDALVATVPGEAFGAPDCIRLSYAAPDDHLKSAIRQIRKSLIKLD